MTAAADLPPWLAAFEPFFAATAGSPLAPWCGALRGLAAARLVPSRHGDLAGWAAAVAALPLPEPQPQPQSVPALKPEPDPGREPGPVREPAQVRLDAPCVGVAAEPPLDAAGRARLAGLLDRLHPWRKGPFCLHGVRIDAEWRSDLKWARLAAAGVPLADRVVLDVGCGNGYYGYRALGAGARLVLGVDPAARAVMQFLAVNRLIGERRLAVLPLADDDLPDGLTGIDTVLSMGVLYHRRDHARHLARLRRLLRPGGTLVLETLVLDEPGTRVLVPPGRYAKMRNVHAIPALGALRGWLAQAGLRSIRIADVTPTTSAEQRRTPWMRFESLADFLDPADPGRTVEGHPAPVRVLVLAEA